VFIHCSAASGEQYGDVDIIRSWHENRGFNDVGYHYFIPYSGELQIGRSINLTPAAQKGNNTGTIAICLHGLRQIDFKIEQFVTLIKLCRQIDIAYDNKDDAGITFHGHSEVSLKSCPVFDYRDVLSLDHLGYMTGVRPIVEIFDHNINVALVQLQLNVFFDQINPDQDVEMGIPVDGMFGQGTAQAVLYFQSENNLLTDAIVGPATYLMLPSIED